MEFISLKNSNIFIVSTNGRSIFSDSPTKGNTPKN